MLSTDGANTVKTNSQQSISPFQLANSVANKNNDEEEKKETPGQQRSGKSVKNAKDQLIKDYHTLRDQMREFDSIGRMDLKRMKQCLSFSERYLEELINCSLTIKDKEGKIMKIVAHNKKLTDEIDTYIQTESNGLIPARGGRLSLHSINDTPNNHRNKMQKPQRSQLALRSQQSSCEACRDLVPILEQQLAEKDLEIDRLLDQIAQLKSSNQAAN